MKIQREKNWDWALLLFIIIMIWALLAVFTGMGPLSVNPYNSYSLQASAWLNGRLDLGQNYQHLELAIFEGKYFVSFPPLPSIILLPMVALFGVATPDNLICAVALCTGALFAYGTALRMGWAYKYALFAALFLTAGSNLVFVGFCGWVWFLAQTLSFAFTMGAIYFALGSGRNSAMCSLLLLCCAAGCRPFQMVYLPVVLFLLWKTSGDNFGDWVRRYWLCVVPAAVLGCVYMGLNLTRFGNIFEFGHNYLPEFTTAEHGQFSPVYLLENLYNLIRLPPMEKGRMLFPQFNGFNLFLVNPLFLSALVAIFKHKEKCDWKLVAMAGGLVVLNLILLCLHRTMGGWQFGNRYTIDALPVAFLIYLSLKDKPTTTDGVFALFGFTLNFTGTVITYLL